MKKTLKLLGQGFIVGVGIFLGIITLFAAWNSTTYTAGDNTLTADSGETLTLAKWNELVSRIRGVETDSSGDVKISSLAGSSNRCVYADANGILQTDTENCNASTASTEESRKTPTLQNNWVLYDTNRASAGYYKDSLGIVHLKGLVKNGTIGACIFTLPSGYIPTERILTITMSNQTAGRIDIDTTGCIIPTLGSNTWVSLDNISFRVE